MEGLCRREKQKLENIKDHGGNKGFKKKKKNKNVANAAENGIIELQLLGR